MGVSFTALMSCIFTPARRLMLPPPGALMGSSFRYVIPTGEDGGAAAGKKRVEHLGSKSKVALGSWRCV